MAAPISQPAGYQEVPLQLHPHTEALACLMGPNNNNNNNTNEAVTSSEGAAKPRAKVLTIGAPGLPLLREAARQMLGERGYSSGVQQPVTTTHYSLPRNLLSSLADQQGLHADACDGAQLACMPVGEHVGKKRAADSQPAPDGGYDIPITALGSLAVVRGHVSTHMRQPASDSVPLVSAAAGPDENGGAAAAAAAAMRSQQLFKRRKLAPGAGTPPLPPATTPIASAHQANKWLQDLSRVPDARQLVAAAVQPQSKKDQRVLDGLHDPHVCQLIQLKQGLKLASKAGRVDDVIALLEGLASMNVCPALLAASQVGPAVSKLRKHTDARVSSKARDLLSAWCALLSSHLLASPLLRNARAGARAAAAGAPATKPHASRPVPSSGAPIPTAAVAAPARAVGGLAHTASKEAPGGTQPMGRNRSVVKAPAKGNLWTADEVHAYLQVLREHGRNTERLQAALPHRSISSLRNFYQTQRVKLNLDELLISLGHSTKPITRASASALLPHLKPSPARTSAEAGNGRAADTMQTSSGAASEEATMSEPITDGPGSSDGKAVLQPEGAQAGHMHGLGLMHSTLLSHSKGGKVRPRPLPPARTATPLPLDQLPCSTCAGESQLGSMGYGGGWPEQQLLQDETPSQGTGMGTGIGMGYGAAGQSTGAMVSMGRQDVMCVEEDDEEEQLLLMPKDSTGLNGLPSPRVDPYAGPLVGGSGLLNLAHSMQAGLAIMDATW